ncbi:PTS sucrose transporter subunit IIBC [Paenalkalicoccus suaedae]|uniref:protein-N(pi)-phosphohistidine--sucrose phosphotransferase n=1 Tax=Paenalkalicoccus suaedae TaxID=2592382 RepID=A0A859FBT3_9BACI|nr:sucrose-specific PTS transporter subunit IIBC [Paenalkalicoccus suaedae]QKS70507.1 PTS sucrose transporter subunit IIBC [Paenalkalicoccus suaedae]
MNYRNEAENILEAIGGQENIQAMTHCATRLRLVLQDEELIDQKRLDDMDIVKGTFSTAGQYQIILGTGIVNNVYRELVAITGIEEMSKDDVKQAGSKKGNPLQRFVKMLSDIFVPIIPAIVAAGLLMGIHNVFTATGLFIDDASLIDVYPHLEDTAAMINTFSNAAFVFLPILIGFSAAKRFGGNAYLGAALGMIMVHPDLLNGYGYGEAIVNNEVPVWNILGLEIERVGYQGTVLPVLVASFVLAKIEIGIRKIMPAALDNLLTPLLTIILTSFITFVAVGPFTRSAGDVLTNGIVWLYETAGFVGGALMGVLYAPFVITGMHHSFIAVETQLLANVMVTGGSFIFPIAAMSNIAQGAAAIAVIFITRNKKMKSVASAAGISSLLGITEPAMFGVNLKLKYPFVAAIIGSAVASAYITFNQTLSVALGAAGLPGIISIRAESIVHFIIGMAISFTVTVILTYLFSKRKKNQIANQEEQQAA